MHSPIDIFYNVVVNNDVVQNHLLPCEPSQVLPVVRPDGSREWIPIVHDDAKPVVGMRFCSVYDAFRFYKQYAVASGFVVRKSTKTKLKDGVTVNFQYFVCRREGYKKNINLKKDRNRLDIRCGCKAKMIIKYCFDNGVWYKVTTFYEGHVHSLCSAKQTKFEKEGRSLNILHKKMILDNSKVSYIS